MLNETQRREKEIAVYEAVLKLLGQGENLSALTVSRIAAAAGIGKGTVYEYFSSKEEIVRGLGDYCVDDELARIETCLAPCHTLQAAEKAICAYLTELTQQRIAGYQVVARMLAQTAQHFPPVEPETVLGRLCGLLQALFARLQAAGEIAPETEPDYFIQVVLSAWLPYAVCLSRCNCIPHQLDGDRVLARTRRMVEKALR